MKGLSSTPSNNRRSASTCSFCRSPKHRVSDCPHVKPIWESLQQGIIPLAYMRTVEDNDTSGQTNSWKQAILTGLVRYLPTTQTEMLGETYIR